MRVVVEDAWLSFGSRAVLEGVSAHFEGGKVTALVGPSGSGKTSLLSAMAGYLSLDSGTIRFVDRDGQSTAPDPQKVSWISQNANSLGARSAMDNVMIAALSEGKSLQDANDLATSALQEVALGTLGHRPAKTLSGGELQRVAFARALTSTRPLIFADEPSSSLDAANTRNLAGILGSLRSRATIIVATHDPILIQEAERVVDLRAS